MLEPGVFPWHMPGRDTGRQREVTREGLDTAVRRRELFHGRIDAVRLFEKCYR